MTQKAILDEKIRNEYKKNQFDKPMQQTSCVQTDNRFESIATLSDCFTRPMKHPMNQGSLDQLAGYDNLQDNTFYLDPDENNTYHNYPVLQENGSYCSMNHQIFMNNTKRNTSSFVQPERPVSNVDDLIPDSKPKYLGMHSCSGKP